MAVKNTGDYTISGADLYFKSTICATTLGSDTGFQIAANNIGNVYDVEISSDVTYVDHFISSRSKRVKDKTVANLSTITINFNTDELSMNNMAKFFLASTNGSDIRVLQNTAIEGSAHLRMDTDVGQSICYRIPKCSIKPNGAFSTANGEDWQSMPMMLDILEYTTGDGSNATWLAQPFGVIDPTVSY